MDRRYPIAMRNNGAEVTIVSPTGSVNVRDYIPARNLLLDVNNREKIGGFVRTRRNGRSVPAVTNRDICRH